MEDKTIEVTRYNESLYEGRELVSLGSLTAYDHLYNMCKHVRNKSHSGSGYINPITPRLEYIMQSLGAMGIDWKISFLDAHNNVLTSSGKKLANIIVEFKSDMNYASTVVFSAHHDIANPSSENCQDNTASVCNLIELCSLLQNTPSEDLAHNVVIAFTDCEEIGGKGMNKLVEEIKEGIYGDVELMYALELTACGDKYWIQGAEDDTELFKLLEDSIKDGELTKVNTPYNESVNARRNMLDACCIGTLTEGELESVNSRGYCGTWGLCHSKEDTFEKSANMNDMKHFNETLLRMVTNKNS